MTQLSNINIDNMEVLVTPAELKLALPLQGVARDMVAAGRETICHILDREDPRLLVVVGPCSLHDPKSAMEYARRLKQLADELQDKLYIVMRVYFEKPRTTIGWKGLINDPHLDGSFDIQAGLQLGRRLLIDINALGLPCATEALDPITPQYLQDCVSWSAIGARTTESQTHREMASGLSMPVGFKNGTDGNIQVAINAMQSVSAPHSFLGINQSGQVAMIQTRGNRYAHVVLRGGNDKPNYDSVSIKACIDTLADNQLPTNIMVDCSHANSNKRPQNQPLVLQDVVQQRLHGNRDIIGVMLESHLFAGKQSIGKDLNQLAYGISITDACIDWETTARCLREVAQTL
jgi:3-deoxy-7-phosphoheptulonate synthase